MASSYTLNGDTEKSGFKSPFSRISNFSMKDSGFTFNENLISMKNLMVDSDSDDEEEEESHCGGTSKGLPMCTRGVSPPSPMYRKVQTESHLDWPPSNEIHTLTKNAYSYGTLPRCQVLRQSFGSLSKSRRGSQSNSDIQLLRLPPEDIAAQITLSDLPIFKAITPDELSSCGWTKRNKIKLAPNVVEFTRRFNHISFWAVREILTAASSKERTETLSFFIRVAKRLNELSNFHSQFAVVSALQSASVYRLRKTWAALSKKDRTTFDKMCHLFSDTNNWERLRGLVNSLKLPMIPYLGLFLTDIVYIDMAHPHLGGGLEPEQRRLKMNNILRVLADYQLSTYPHLRPDPAIGHYLSSFRYIEELQKFVEDDHYKLSLKIEPPTSAAPSHSASKDSLFESCVGGGASISPQESPSHQEAPYGGAPGEGSFMPGHRKVKSLGNKFRSLSLPRNASGLDLAYGQERQNGSAQLSVSGLSLSPPDGGRRLGKRHRTSIGLLSGSRNAHSPTHCSTDVTDGFNKTAGSRHLLDDSKIDDDCLRVAFDASGFGSEWSSDSEDVVVLEMNSGECCIQGPLKRKAMFKAGRKPRVSSWHRYWVQLWDGALVFYHQRSLSGKGVDRSDFKTSPCKVQLLFNPESGKLRIFEPLDPSVNGETFQISDSSWQNVYKFRAPSRAAAKAWLSSLNQALSQEPSGKHADDLITFD